MNNSARRSTSVWTAIAAVIVGIEAAMVAVVGAGYAFYAVVGQADGVAPIVALAAFSLALAAALGASGAGLWRSRRWARSLALTWQVLQVAVGLSYWESHLGVALALVGVALVVAVILFRDAARENSAPESS